MMEQVKDWLMAVITVSVVIAGAQSLMPPGGPRQVGGLVCGLVLLCVLMQPLYAVNGTSVVRFLEEYRFTVRMRESELEQQTDRSRKTVIEDFFAAYVVDKAAQLGLDCRVDVDCVLNEDGLWLPAGVRLWGCFDDVTQSRLTQLLESELGIPRSAQTYYLT